MSTSSYLTDPNAPLPEHIKGLIFDCDGTLIDTMPIHFRAWTATCQRHGLAFPEEQFYAFAGMPTQRIVETLCQEQKVTLDAAAVGHEKEQTYLQMMPQAKAIAATVAIARRERGRRKLAVASGGFRAIVLEALGIIGATELFDAIVGADEVAHGKPHPDMFLEAARRVGVEPKACLVYEDGEFGFRAARAAGMTSVDVRPWYVSRTSGR